MMERRQFLAFLAAAPALGKIPVREAGRVETVFKSPGPYPNGLQATDEGLWIIDGEDARAHLVSYSDGTVLRGFDTEAVHPSGITFDGRRSGWRRPTAGRSSAPMPPAARPLPSISRRARA